MGHQKRPRVPKNSPVLLELVQGCSKEQRDAVGWKQVCLVEHRASPTRGYVKMCTWKGFQEGFLEEVTPQLSLLVCKSWKRGRGTSGRWDTVSKQAGLCAGWEAAEIVSTPHCTGGEELWSPRGPALVTRLGVPKSRAPPGHVQTPLCAETRPMVGG